MRVNANVEMPTLKEHGLAIGEAARNGDKDAQKIYNWYATSHRIGDAFGIAHAEQLAVEWVKRKAHNATDTGEG